jgi:steroid delta-isomerase-like uncharacterized protein
MRMTQQEQNKAFVRRAMDDFFNQHDLTAPDRIYAPAFVQHNERVAAAARSRGLSNVEGVKHFFTGFFQAFPDYRVEIEHIMAEDDKVFVVCNWFGTHRGEFMGVPATGKPIRVRTAEVLRIQDGRIAEHWDVEDQMEMMLALGMLAPANPATPEAA